MIGLILLGIGIIGSAILWRIGGNGFDLARNPGVPILIGVLKTVLLSLGGWSWWNLLALAYILIGWAVIQAFSYGINAPIHKLWVMIFGKGDDGNYEPVEIATRATVGFLWSLGGILFAFLTGNWLIFGLYVIFLTVANAFFGRIKNVEISERLVGASFSTVLLV